MSAKYSYSQPKKYQILETSNEIWIKVKLISFCMTLSHGVMKSDASSTQIYYLPSRELPKVMESMMTLQTLKNCKGVEKAVRLWAASIKVNNQLQGMNRWYATTKKSQYLTLVFTHISSILCYTRILRVLSIRAKHKNYINCWSIKFFTKTCREWSLIITQASRLHVNNNKKNTASTAIYIFIQLDGKIAFRFGLC